MTSRDMAQTLTFDPSHREASARFAEYVANGRDVRGAALRDFSVDSTAHGAAPEILGGSLNPDYTTLQRAMRRDIWSRFRQQLAPPPPPPPVQIFGRPTGRPGAPPARIQFFPGWDPQTPQTTGVFSGSF